MSTEEMPELSAEELSIMSPLGIKYYNDIRDERSDKIEHRNMNELIDNIGRENGWIFKQSNNHR